MLLPHFIVKEVYLTCSYMIILMNCTSNCQDVSEVYEFEDGNIQNVCDILKLSSVSQRCMYTDIQAVLEVITFVVSLSLKK